MKQLLRLLFYFTPFLLFSCEYNLSGSHFEEVNPQPENVISDLSLEGAEDTIFVRGEPNLKFFMWLPNRTFYGYVLLLNNKVISQGYSPTGSYQFPSNMYEDGYYTLQLSAIANSGTGSLADINWLEAIEVYRTWILHVDNSPPTSISITDVSPKDGRLQVTWQHFGKRKGFKEYRLLKNNLTVAIITDPNITSWVDDAYIGGPVTYSVVSYAHGYSFNGSTQGPVYSYDYPLPQILHSTFDEEKGITAIFSSTPFFRNFSYYEITSPYAEIGYKTTNVTDTVVTFRNPGFGHSYDVKLHTTARNAHYQLSGSYTESQLTGMPGGAWGPYNLSYLYRRPGTDFFYSFRDDGITLIDAKTLQVKQVRHEALQWMDYDPYKHVISEDGRYMYVIFSGKLHKLNPTTLQTQRTYNLKELLPYSNYSHYRLSVSNNNRLAIEAHNEVSSKDTVYLLDMEQNRILTKQRAMFSPSLAAISPDGNALKLDNRLYLAQSNGSWTQQGAASENLRHIVFHPSKPLFAIKRDLEISFYSTVTGALQKKLQTETALGEFAIDDGSGILYGKDLYDFFCMYDFESGKLKRRIKLGLSVNAFLYKNRIYSDQRYAEL